MKLSEFEISAMRSKIYRVCVKYKQSWKQPSRF